MTEKANEHQKNLKNIWGVNKSHNQKIPLTYEDPRIAKIMANVNKTLKAGREHFKLYPVTVTAEEAARIGQTRKLKKNRTIYPKKTPLTRYNEYSNFFSHNTEKNLLDFPKVTREEELAGLFEGKKNRKATRKNKRTGRTSITA